MGRDGMGRWDVGSAVRSQDVCRGLQSAPARGAGSIRARAADSTGAHPHCPNINNAAVAPLDQTGCAVGPGRRDRSPPLSHLSV
jgi:hypothetical protein